MVPMIVQGSAAVPPHDAIEPDRESSVSKNTARSAESTPWLPWTRYYSPTTVVSDTARERSFGADGVESYSHEEKMGHEAKDRAEEISSSSSFTTTLQTPTTVDPSSLNYTHNSITCTMRTRCDPPIGNNPVASTITSHTWLGIL